MEKQGYQSLEETFRLNRRNFCKLSGIMGTGLMLGTPALWSRDREKNQDQTRIKTNIDDALKVPKTKHALPGPFPGRVVEVQDPQVTKEDQPDIQRLQKMFEQGLETLTERNLKKSFKLFFEKQDIIGIKVNPVGAPHINTHPEVVQVILDWLLQNGMRKENIIIWDRFDYMLTDAGFTPERFPGIGIEGLQTMDESAAGGESDDNSRWLDRDGNHVSVKNFNQEVYFWADVEGPKDLPYLNQHVFNGKYSYFGKLLTEKLTKIINVPAFKNTGNGVSMATKNMGYGSVCNTNRLHRPLFFDVNVEVMAFPVIRDKLVLNITDAIRGQYDGGPAAATQFIYPLNKLYLATDPFALDLICHHSIMDKRKEMNVKVNEHPRFTEYFRYAEKLGLGIGHPEKVNHICV